jgi:Mn2+/Fe2+ NRAMP family transporter
LQLFIPYRRYARFLMVLTFSLFAYVAIMFLLPLDWKAIGAGLIGLHPNLTESAATTIVAIFGTTISPYLFFWQSAQEVEEVDQDDDAHPLIDRPREAPAAIERIRIDTIAGMLASNLIALAIMIATAATLHAHGITNINTAADAASALKPIAGRFAFGLFSIGIIGTGLLAIPVLAGSAGYAVAEAAGWKTGLDNMPWQARGFYSVIGAAVLLGLGIDWSPLDPIKALYWSAVLNGVIAVPMMAALMFVAQSRAKMGKFRAGWVLGALGWLSTAVMAAATITMLYVSLK